MKLAIALATAPTLFLPIPVSASSRGLGSESRAVASISFEAQMHRALLGSEVLRKTTESEDNFEYFSPRLISTKTIKAKIRLLGKIKPKPYVFEDDET